jgi:hypothetical protein
MSQKFLAVYSGVLTVVFAVTVLSGFAPRAKKTVFDEIDVQRINVIEPDGTLRMIVSGRKKAPGIIIKGKEYPHETRSTAGIIFFNDEGTENGGLTFGGSKDKDGKTRSFGHLSFDQYMQDQVFTIDASEENGQRRSGLAVVDRGEYSILETLELLARTKGLPQSERQAEMKKFLASHPGDAQRLYLGRGRDRSVGLTLKDTEGRDRIVLRVAADGTPGLQFLDSAGKVVANFPPTP